MVSCSSNEYPEQVHKYLELVGFWTTDTYTYNGALGFYVYNNGNIAYINKGGYYGNYTNYSNFLDTKIKIDDNFDYPYATKVYCRSICQCELTITFESASKASVSGPFSYGFDNWRDTTKNETHNYIKNNYVN